MASMAAFQKISRTYNTRLLPIIVQLGMDGGGQIFSGDHTTEEREREETRVVVRCM